MSIFQFNFTVLQMLQTKRTRQLYMVEESVTLIVSKSKVNPKKSKKTIPKLELCAAHLLNKLYRMMSLKVGR